MIRCDALVPERGYTIMDQILACQVIALYDTKEPGVE
jgi:hypothetical protein